MTAETLSALLRIALLNAAYVTALTWLSWTWYRRTGRDGFENVAAFAVGMMMVHWMAGATGAGAAVTVAAAVAAAFAASSGMLLWAQDEAASRRSGLVGPIVFASVALLTLDAVTSHTPVALMLRGPVYPLVLAGVTLLLVVCIVAVLASRYGAVLRLGHGNRWAVPAWCRPEPRPNAWYPASLLVSWALVLTVPLVTTGVLASTILRDVTLGLLLARIAGAGRMVTIMGVSVTLAGLRSAAGYAFVGTAGPPLVEATIFIAILLWISARSARTPWVSAHAG
jgi:hypothetical protein